MFAAALPTPPAPFPPPDASFELLHVVRRRKQGRVCEGNLAFYPGSPDHARWPGMDDAGSGSGSRGPAGAGSAGAALGPVQSRVALVPDPSPNRVRADFATSSSHPAATPPVVSVPFRMGLTPEEAAARTNVRLPFEHQASCGRVHHPSAWAGGAPGAAF